MRERELHEVLSTWRGTWSLYTRFVPQTGLRGTLTASETLLRMFARMTEQLADGKLAGKLVRTRDR